MKTSFSRSFSTIAAILLLSLTVLGAAFQRLVKEYMADNTISGLKQDAQIIADLASAYSLDGNLMNKSFLVNLDTASKVSDADVVICDEKGHILLCSRSLLGCEHQGLRFQESYIRKVIHQGGDSATGVITGLYSDHRYVVAVPIQSSSGVRGVVVVSRPCCPPVRAGSQSLRPPGKRSSAGHGPGSQCLRPRQSPGPGPGGGQQQRRNGRAGHCLQQHGILPPKK